MDDFALGLFGCVIVLGIVIAPIALFVSLFRRLGTVERQLLELRSGVERAEAAARFAAARVRDLPPSSEEAVTPASEAVAPVEAPAPVPTPAATPPSADTVVSMPAPAYFETRAAAEPAPAAPKPPSADTVVSTPLPAMFETRASGAPASPPAPATATPTATPTAAPTAAPAAAPTATPPARLAKPGRSLEETLSTRLPVWIAAVAIALGAAYGVKYSFDQGWIGFGLRVALGVLLGVGLLVGGEWLRKGSDYVAKGLSAAGIAALFVSFFAATSLYQLIPPAAGFALMALTTATAVALSLRQGYIVAIVGLLGGFITPALAGTAAESSGVLFAYLLLLEIGLVFVAKKRSWGALPVLTLLGGLVWVFSRLGSPSHVDSLFIGLFLVATTGLFLLGLSTLGQAIAERRQAGQLPYLPALRWISLAGALLAMAGLLSSRDYGTLEWAFLGLIAAGAFVLARLEEDYHGLAWFAAGAVTFLLFGYVGVLGPHPERAGAFITTHLIFGGLIVAGAFAAHFRSRYPGRFAALASLAGLVYLLTEYFNSVRLGIDGLSWGAISLGLAVVYTAFALPAAQRRAADPGAEAPLAAFAVGATCFLSLALPLELERQWLTVAWALEVWALLWLAERIRVKELRTFAEILCVVVAVRLLFNPEVLSYPIGTTPIFNWLLYGYGIPLAAFVMAARLARRQKVGARLEEGLEWLAQAFAFALVSLEIRHFFYRDAGNLGQLESGATGTHLVEWGTYGTFWLLLVLLQLWVGDRVSGPAGPDRPLRWGPRLAYAGVTGLTVLFTGLVLNPLWNAEYVGETPILNWLLWIYGVPAALRMVLAASFERRGQRWLARLGNVAGLLEIFLLITFEVRQFFQGSRLDAGSPSLGENLAYSLAWIALAFAMALVGVRAASKGLRFGSAIIMGVAVFKVFLFDTSSLEGIFRVLSLFGLGGALFVLAYLYRRFVFPPGADKDDGAAGQATAGGGAP